MKIRTLFSVVAVSFAAFTVTVCPQTALAQTRVAPLSPIWSGASTTQANTNKSRGLAFRSVVLGGAANLVESNVVASTIGGGRSNAIEAFSSNAVIGGGFQNVIVTSNVNLDLGDAGGCGTVGGGAHNRAIGAQATVGGGGYNAALHYATTVAGGAVNRAEAYGATVGGGVGNFATGDYSTVPGGHNGRAVHRGSFVWSGVGNDGALEPASPGAQTHSTNPNSFTVRAPGGVRFITTMVDSLSVSNGTPAEYGAPGLTNGVYLAPNSGAWASLSDSNAKTGIKPIDARKILSKLVSMPVTEWKYKVDPNRRYIGPMAQDFHTAFGLGSDDKSITTLDSDGVMYAAIQGLVEELRDRDVKIGELEAKSAEIDALKAKMEAMEERFNSLTPAP